MSSPFYDIYTKHKDIIDSAIDKAIEESAKKLGRDLVSELFSMRNLNGSLLKQLENKYK